MEYTGIENTENTDDTLPRPLCGIPKSYLRAIKEALDLLPDVFDGWWCPDCQSEVDATFTEHCSSCGLPLLDCQPSNETAKKKEDALSMVNTLEKEASNVSGLLVDFRFY